MTTVINGLGELESVFSEIDQSVSGADFEPSLAESQKDIADYEAGMFAGEHDSSLSPWAPLKPSTIKRKGHDRILVETGALRESLVHVGGPGNISETSARGMIFGTDVEYAVFHQNGTSKMVARPPVGVSEETLDKMVNKIADATVEILKNSGS